MQKEQQKRGSCLSFVVCRKVRKVTLDSNRTWEYTNHNGKRVCYVEKYPDFKEAGAVRQEVDIGEFQGRSRDRRKADKLAPNGPIDTKITVWHHHQDRRTMQAVDRATHDSFTHLGGIANWKRGKQK